MMQIKTNQEMLLRINDFADKKKGQLIEEKKYLLDFVVQERDKKIDFYLQLIKSFLRSGVIIAMLQIFNNEIKICVRLLWGYLSKITF